MIITRTPLRVSFFGGGTDYPDHFREHGGQTLGVAINYYSYITVKSLAPLFDYAIRVGYRRTELAQHLDEVEHPSVRECLRYMGVEGNVEVDYIGDLPARSGLGSSSSFTVGLLHALHAYKGELTTRDQLAREAVYVEQQMIGERVGVQDQYLCAHGGLTHLKMRRDGQIKAQAVPLRSNRLEDFHSHLMLFYTGLQRNAHDVLDEQIANTRQGTVTADLHQMSDLVDQGIEVLTSERSLSVFGELLHDAWEIKRGLSRKISNADIDRHYAAARRAGAVGGKLLGAGGGGFLLFVAPPERQAGIARALWPLKQVPFQFDFTGSDIAFYHPEGHLVTPQAVTLERAA